MIYISTCCLKGDNSRYKKSIFDVLDVYQKLGINNIELGAGHSHEPDLSPIFKLRKHGFNFIIHGFFPTPKQGFLMNISSQTEILQKTINLAKNSIEFCRKIDSTLYGIHMGYLAEMTADAEKILSPLTTYKKAIATAIETTTLICEYAKDYGVNIAVENMPYVNKATILNKYREFDDLFKAVKMKNLGLLLDIGHLTKASDALAIDKENFIKKFKNKIIEMHSHEVVDGIDHQPVNSSTLSDFDKSFLKKIAVTLESHLLSPEQIIHCKRILENSCS